MLADTLVGTVAGARLPGGVQQRVLAGLGLVTLVLGVDNALAWRDADGPELVLCVLGAVLLGGIVGELLALEDRLSRLGDRLQARFARSGERAGAGADPPQEPSSSRVSEAFFTASLLFCVGPLAVLGSIDDGLRGDIELLATKSVLDGFAAVALAAVLGPGVALSAGAVLLVQGSLTLGAGLFEDVLVGEPLTALTSAGGILIIGIALKLSDLKDVKVGNFLPALALAPLLAWLFA